MLPSRFKTVYTHFRKISHKPWECEMKLYLLALSIGFMPTSIEAQEVKGFETSVTKFLGVKMPDLPQMLHLKQGEPKLGKGARVTWSFVRERIENRNARNCQVMGPLSEVLSTSQLTLETVKREVERGFAFWSEIANIDFEYTDDEKKADIKIGEMLDPEGWAFANVFFDTAQKGDIRTITRSYVCLSPLRLWSVDDLQREEGAPFKSYCIRYTIAHEIGHAIGLDHPSGAGHLMSYRYEGCILVGSKKDIGGAQLLYGKREKPPSG